MSVLKRALNRAVVPLACLICLGAVTAGVSLAVGAPATVAKKAKVKVKCPNKPGNTVTCKVKGKLPKGPRGHKGAKGSQGEQGPKGQKGNVGPSGLSGYEIVNETFTEVFAANSGGQRGLSEVKTVDCPSGKMAIGGGADLGTNATQNGQQRQMILSSSVPTSSGDGWSVQLFNNSTSIDSSIDLEVYAICATVG